MEIKQITLSKHAQEVQYAICHIHVALVYCHIDKNKLITALACLPYRGIPSCKYMCATIFLPSQKYHENFITKSLGDYQRVNNPYAIISPTLKVLFEL